MILGLGLDRPYWMCVYVRPPWLSKDSLLDFGREREERGELLSLAVASRCFLSAIRQVPDCSLTFLRFCYHSSRAGHSYRQASSTCVGGNQGRKSPILTLKKVFCVVEI